MSDSFTAATFDMPGYQTNFPIARDATAQRGLDYLAVGDTHGYREIPRMPWRPSSTQVRQSRPALRMSGRQRRDRHA